jgi:hypothetical protein
MCTCNQLSICRDCARFHNKHVYLDANQLENFWKDEEAEDLSPVSYINDLISKIERKQQNLLDSLSDNVYILKNPLNPPYTCNIFIDPSLEHLNQQVFIANEDNFICEFDLSSNTMINRDIQVEPNLKRPFWIFKWKDFFIVLGGTLGGTINSKNIYQISIDTKTTTVIAQMKMQITLFYPVIHDDVLYIVGGRFKKNMRESTVLDTITAYPLNQPENHFEIKMIRPRYGVTACMHRGELHVFSFDAQNSCEIINLETKETREIYTESRITYGSGVVSYDENMILLNQNEIIIIDEKYSANSIESLAELNETLAGDYWNQVQPPVLFDGKFYTFGIKGFIIFDIQSREVVYRDYSFPFNS